MAGSISTKSPKDKSVQQVEGRSSERVPQLLAPSGPQADVLALQDAAGNRAVSQLLQSDIDSLAPGGNGLPPIVQDVLRSPGEPLDPAARAFMELRFNHDFREVRVHTDQRAAESAQIINALAYTVGRDVVFGASQYTPETTQGRCLLAHELAHVVQQSPGAKVFDCRLTVRATADNSLEREADAIGYAVALGRNAIVRRKTRPLLQTQSPRRDQTASPQQIEIDVIGHELGQGTERSADVNYPIRARDAIGADLVVTSLEDLIARLSALTAGNACVRKLTIWNHGSPRGQRVAFDGNDNDRWSGFNLRWLLKGANRRRLEQFRQVFCCGAEMRWMGCSTLAVETTWDPRSKPKRGRRPPRVFRTSEEAIAHDVSLLGARFGQINVQSWADATCTTITAANDVYIPLTGRLARGGRWIRRPPRSRCCDPVSATGRPSGAPPFPLELEEAAETMQTAIVDPTRVSCERVTIADKRAFIEASDLQDRVVAIIRRKIRVSRRRRSVHQGQRFSIGLLRRADAAVRAEFGAMLPASLDPTRPDIIQVHTPQEIGRLRAPNRDKALTLIGEEALSISQELARERAAEVQRRRVLAVDPADFDVLRLACIRDSRDPALREALSQPVLDHLSLARIQELQATQIPGVTSAGRRIDIVARNPYLGHILVHELIHFYEHPDYRKLRSPDPHAGPHPHALALREGGSEFLARHVIQTRLIQGSSAQPDEFRIRFETYRSEAQFISEVVRRMGGVESYARAYFQGRIDLITAVLP